MAFVAPKSDLEPQESAGFVVPSADREQAPAAQPEKTFARRVGERLAREVKAIPDALAGSVELPLQLATGAIAVPLGYVAGTGAAVLGKDGKAVKDETIDRFTYKPRTVSAQRSGQVLGKALTPIVKVGEAAGEFQQGLGGQPGLINDATKDVAMMIAGGAAARAAPKVVSTVKSGAEATGRAAVQTYKGAKAASKAVGDIVTPEMQQTMALGHLAAGDVVGAAVQGGMGAARKSWANRKQIQKAAEQPVEVTVAKVPDVTTKAEAASVAQLIADRRAAAGLNQNVRVLPDGRVVRRTAQEVPTDAQLAADRARTGLR